MVVKVMDLVGESTNSWDEAIKGAVQQASKTDEQYNRSRGSQPDSRGSGWSNY